MRAGAARFRCRACACPPGRCRCRGRCDDASHEWCHTADGLKPPPNASTEYIESFRRMEAEYDKQIKALNEKIHELDTQNAQLRSQYEELVRNDAFLERTMQEKTEANKMMASAYKNLKKQLDDLQTQNSELQKALEAPLLHEQPPPPPPADTVPADTVLAEPSTGGTGNA